MAIDLGNLNPEQKRAVLEVTRPVLLMAPMGTGKTKVLALRAAYAIDSGIEASSILCLSFTNRAAKEVKERLTQLLGRAGDGVTTRTFHSLCAMIIRSESDVIGIDYDFVVWDEEDSSEVLKRLIRRFGIQVGQEDIDKVVGCISTSLAAFRLASYERSKSESVDHVFHRNLRGLKLKATSRDQDFLCSQMLDSYLAELRENHALDFVDLIIQVSDVFKNNARVLTRWQERFRWIQVDEVQDTNWSEYSILAAIGKKHRQVSFFGDVDQTIYEWRGSVPREVIAVFKKEFGPVIEINLKRNYRSTQKILEACGRIIGSYQGAVTHQMECHSRVPGEAVMIHSEPDPVSEAHWLADRIREFQKADKCKFRNFAILTRTNGRATVISRVLENELIPHFVADQFRFFLRAEIKDAIAHLRFLLNTHDSNAFRRILQRPPKGIGQATIDAIQAIDRRTCVRLVDFVNPITLKYADPYAPLLDAFVSGNIVIFDVESTGLDTVSDEVVELAAAKVNHNGRQDEFHAYLKSKKPVGDSFSVHTLSDQFLAQKGENPKKVLEEFASFCEGCVLVGHNVTFDKNIIESQGRRIGARNPTVGLCFDTLDIARRLLRLPSYTLQSLHDTLKLKHKPTHRAQDDVRTTEDLLRHLVDLLTPGAAERRKVLRGRMAPFANLAYQLEAWRSGIANKRPHELLALVLEESGLAAYWRKQEDGEKRQRNLGELVDLFGQYDDLRLSGRDALQEILLTVSLGSDTERLLQKDDRVLLVTVHQAKGLEFDTVFVAAATDEDFPSYLSKRDGRVEEEHRVFYVAASRAKRRLVFSYFRENDWGYIQQPSRFLTCLSAPKVR